MPAEVWAEIDGVKTPYTADPYNAISSIQTHADGQNKGKGRDGQSKHKQAEVENAYASHGLAGVFGASKGCNEPERNLGRISENRIACRLIGPDLSRRGRA